MNLSATIARLEEEGFTPDQIVAMLKCLVLTSQPAASIEEIRAERKREADRVRMAERRATVALQSRDTVQKKVSDKEIPHTPLEINFQENNYYAQGTEADTETQAFEAWNDLASELGLPKAQILTAERRRKIKSRLNECGGLDGWRDALAKIRGSPLCRGENDRGWRADLDFLLQRKSFTRLMEGSYDGRSPGRHANAGSVNSRSENERILADILAEAKRREDGEGNSDVPGVDARAA